MPTKVSWRLARAPIRLRALVIPSPELLALALMRKHGVRSQADLAIALKVRERTVNRWFANEGGPKWATAIQALEELGWLNEDAVRRASLEEAGELARRAEERAQKASKRGRTREELATGEASE